MMERCRTLWQSKGSPWLSSTTAKRTAAGWPILLRSPVVQSAAPSIHASKTDLFPSSQGPLRIIAFSSFGAFDAVVAKSAKLDRFQPSLQRLNEGRAVIETTIC